MRDVLWVSYSKGNLVEFEHFYSLMEVEKFIEEHPDANVFYRGRELVLKKEKIQVKS